MYPALHMGATTGKNGADLTPLGGLQLGNRRRLDIRTFPVPRHPQQGMTGENHILDRLERSNLPLLHRHIDQTGYSWPNLIYDTRGDADQLALSHFVQIVTIQPPK